MSNTHHITGVGPTQPDGTTILFTVKSKPYYATAAQITSFGRTPLPGDKVVDNGDGTVNLLTNDGQPVAEQPQEDLIDDGGSPNQTENV